MHANNNSENNIMTKNHSFMVLLYADNIIKVVKISLKNSVKLDFNRFIKVHKDRVSRE